jgi:hypothetical protein
MVALVGACWNSYLVSLGPKGGDPGRAWLQSFYMEMGPGRPEWPGWRGRNPGGVWIQHGAGAHRLKGSVDLVIPQGAGAQQGLRGGELEG